MNKKAVIWIILVAVFAAALASVIIIRRNIVGDNDTQSYSRTEEAKEVEAEFPIKAADRLCGYPATDYEVNGNTVKVIYADEGYITKTLGETKGGAGSGKYAEIAEEDVDGRTVTFKGKGETVYFALWYENGFTYTISLTGGAEIDEMIEYVKATS